MAGGSGDFKIRVGVELDDSKLNTLESKINELSNKPITLDVKLSVDSKDITKDITRQLNRQMSGKLGIDVPIDIASNANMSSIKKQASNMAQAYLADFKKAIKKGKDVRLPDSLTDEAKLFKSGKNFTSKEREAYAEHLTSRLDREIKALSNMENNVGKYTSEQIKRVSENIERDLQALQSLANDFSGKFRKNLQRKITDTGDILGLNIAKGSDAAATQAIKRQEAQVKASFDIMRSQYKELYALQSKQLKLSVDSSEYKSAQQQIDSLRTSIQGIYSQISGGMTQNMFDTLSEDARKAAASTDLLKARLADIDDMNTKTKAQKFLKNYDSDKIFADLDKLSYRFDKLDKPSKTLTSMKDNLDGMRASLGGVVDDFVRTGDTNSLVKWVDDFNNSFDTFKHNLDRAETTQKRLRDSVRDTNKNAKLQNDKDIFSWQIKKWSTDNSAAMNMFGDRIDTIISKIKTADSVQLTGLKSQFKQIQLEAAVAGKDMKNFGDRLKDQVREYGAYALVAGGLAASVQTLRVMAQNVLEVDTAMVGLYRVTDLTSNQYDKLYDNMISSSKEYGRTLTDTINATSDWVRAGFDADTAVGLAGITSMYQNVSDLDYDEATKNLLTAYKGFQETFNGQFAGDSLKSVEHIADVYNKLDNEFAVTAAGLGEGLARSASALEVAGNTFEESAAMVGAISEVTQDPKYIGA